MMLGRGYSCGTRPGKCMGMATNWATEVSLSKCSWDVAEEIELEAYRHNRQMQRKFRDSSLSEGSVSSST